MSIDGIVESLKGDTFTTFAEGLRDRRVYLQPYVGNSGDELIVQGGRRLLNRLRVPLTWNPHEADLILWPGGNPSMWKSNVEQIVAVLDAFPSTAFAIAPATFQDSKVDWRAALHHAGPRLLAVFARDAGSHALLQSAGLNPATIIGLGHDPALQLVNEAWVVEQRAAATREYVLVAFRTDHEAHRSDVRHGLIGVLQQVWPRAARSINRTRGRQSRLEQARASASSTGLPVREADVSSYNPEIFIEAVRRAAVVHTDRLHTMLLAAMLDKEIVAYPTAYGKLESVAAQSLRGYDRLRFVTETAGA
jgi:exopolysaccharide biosynthesis predicted pyruvyltransferase EpsI